MTTGKTAPVAERKGSKIDLGARLVMTALYKRLFSLGLWQHIRSVGGNREKGIGGAYFVTHDNQAFFEDLVRSGKFCKDTAAGSILHKRVISLREVAAQPGLHLELSPDDRIYVHLDEHSPVGGVKADGTCRYEGAKAAVHIRRDVLRAFTGTPYVGQLALRVSPSGKELASAEAAWRKARDSGDSEAAAGPGLTPVALFGHQGPFAPAHRPYRAALAPGHPEVGPAAP